jgi:phosphoglycolate phosphatase
MADAMGAATPEAPLALSLLSFDLDGTLIDTAGEIAEAANRAMAELGLPRVPPDEVALLIGQGGHALMRKLLARFDAAHRGDEACAAYDRHVAETVGGASRPYPGAAECLQRLRAAGFRLACVTNKELAPARRLLEIHRLADAFDLVIGGDSLPWQKPDARVLAHVAEALGVAPAGRARAVAHVGDSAVDVQAARQAGVQAWALPHGYNGGRPVAEAGPDRLFPDLTAVADAALAAQAGAA